MTKLAAFLHITAIMSVLVLLADSASLVNMRPHHGNTNIPTTSVAATTTAPIPEQNISVSIEMVSRLVGALQTIWILLAENVRIT